jgi:hypothetical protein
MRHGVTHFILGDFKIKGKRLILLNSSKLHEGYNKGKQIIPLSEKVISIISYLVTP